MKDPSEQRSSPLPRNQNVTFHFNQLMAKLDSILIGNAFIYLFLFIYVCSVMLMFFWGARDEFKHSRDEPYRWFITIARAFGYTLNLNTMLVILLASRLVFTGLRDTRLNLLIPFDKTFPAFHIVIGYAVTFAVVFHAGFHIVWVFGWNKWQRGLFQVTMSMATGFALAGVLAFMIVTSLPSIRRKRFVLFYVSHNFGAFVFFLLLLFHGVYNGEPYTYKWIVAPLIIYLGDRIMRIVKMKSTKLKLEDNSYTLKGSDVIRIDIPKPFNYQAGHYAELQVRSINRNEWHPFTIASAPDEKTMTFFIKALGDWTKSLRSELEKRVSGEIKEPLDISVRGPFGAPAQHTDGYDHIVLISGGIGATPFVSVCKHVYYQILQSKYTNPGESSSSSDEELGENNEEQPPLIKAEKQLMRGIDFVCKEGGDLTRFETWNYAQSTSPLSISSPRAADAREAEAQRMAKRKRWPGSPIMSEPNLAAGGTPKLLPSYLLKRNQSVGGRRMGGFERGFGSQKSASYSAARSRAPGLFLSPQAGSTPSSHNVHTKIQEEDEGEEEENVSVWTSEKAWPPGHTSTDNNSSKRGVSFHQEKMDKGNTKRVTVGAATSSVSTTPVTLELRKLDIDSEIDEPNTEFKFDVSDIRDMGRSPGSFARKTMNIDDAVTASIVRDKAELRLRSRTARFFHSISVNMFLCLLTLSRVVLVAYMHLFYASYVQGPMKMPGRGSPSAWLTVLDVILGIIVILTLFVSLMVEVLLLQKSFFSNFGLCIDLFVLLPVAAGSIVVSVCALAQGSDHIDPLVAGIHFGVLVGGLTLLMMYRLGRIVGSRVMIADRFRDRGFEKLKAVDFMWTTPYGGDDEWIRDELGGLAEDGKELSLHRYVTREKKEDCLENGVESTKGMNTNFGRPEWEKLFMGIAEKTGSDARVGVFFCGPHGMAKSVEEAMMRVQVKTILRGVYLGTSEDDAIQRELGLVSGREVEVLRSRGSNIHFVFRKENFG